jgi:hypothetical protein
MTVLRLAMGREMANALVVRVSVDSCHDFIVSETAHSSAQGGNPVLALLR